MESVKDTIIYELECWDPDNVRSVEARRKAGWLGILEQGESSAANKGNYQPILRQGYGGVYYDPYAIKVARTDPRSPLPSDPWLRDSHPRQAQQTQPPFDLPARESRIANIKSLDSFIQLDNDQYSSKSVEAWIEAGWQARGKEEAERKTIMKTTDPSQTSSNNVSPTQEIARTIQDHTHPPSLLNAAPASERESDLIQGVRDAGGLPPLWKCRIEWIFTIYFWKMLWAGCSTMFNAWKWCNTLILILGYGTIDLLAVLLIHAFKKMIGRSPESARVNSIHTDLCSTYRYLVSPINQAWFQSPIDCIFLLPLSTLFFS